MENESDATASSRLPHSISEYTLLEFLGEGATAQVYLAEHEASGAHVAIKVIDKLLIRRAQLESKVRQEMVLHAELKHPHVLHVESVFEDARNYYMVLEYCAQRSLSAVVKTLPNRKLDEQIAKTIFRQVVAGVTYLHASGVIHRDLKLANLLLSDTGAIKISDFGLAAKLGDDHVTMCGTPNFIAPEVLMAGNAPYDEAVDVWSLGCILYCLLLGKPPFEGRKVGETLENVANAGQNPLQFPDGFSSSASDLIKRLLTSDPCKRPSAQQIMLHPWLREQSRKRGISSSNANRQLSIGLRSVPSHLHATSQLSQNVRNTYQASKARLTKEKEFEISSSSSSVSRRCNFKERKQRGHREAPARKIKNVKRQSKAAASSSDSCNFDNDSLNDEDNSDLSELSLSTIFDSNDLKWENDTMSQTDANLLYQDSSTHARPVVSVVLHLELQSVSCFGLCDQHEDAATDNKVKLQWSCKEPSEIGRPPMFELEVSNGWQVCYDPAIGLLTATTSKGELMRYDISSVSKAQVNVCVNSTPTARTSYQTRLPLLVRFCQCLALRSMQLRQMALRDQTCKLPLIHYDTLPESLLTSFQHRSSLLKSSLASLMNKDIGGKLDSDSGCCQYIKGSTKRIEISSVGYGCIDETGDLKVTFLDGAQLILAANGLRLRFRPSWAKDSATEEVYELLTGSSMSAFLPSAVKQKLTSIPEFIRRLKATA